MIKHKDKNYSHVSLRKYLNRVFCADARQLIKELPDGSINLIVTDPPYGDNMPYGINERVIQGNEHPLLALETIAAAYRVLKDNASVYMFCGIRHLGFICTFFEAYTRYKFRDVIVWDKLMQGRGHGFRRRYECILVLEQGKPLYRSVVMANLLRCQRVRSDVHPHVKPVELIKTLIAQSSSEKDIVLDPFVGSGTTAVAAKMLNRRFVGVEIDESYCRMAHERLHEVSKETLTSSVMDKAIGRASDSASYYQ